MKLHCFYHADRFGTLSPYQPMELDSNGCSTFGAQYFAAYTSKREDELSDAESRECLLERIRCEPRFFSRPSRFAVLFCALTIEDAVRHASEIEPPIVGDVRVFEVRSRDFVTLDRNWLDYGSAPETRVNNYRCYWWGEISNHNPIEGERRAPRLEVLIPLPVKIGELVASTPAHCGTSFARA